MTNLKQQICFLFCIVCNFVRVYTFTLGGIATRPAFSMTGKRITSTHLSETSVPVVEGKDDAWLSDDDLWSSSSSDTEATLRCLTFCNVPKNKEPDLLCDFLMELGACSTSIIDADRGTDLEQPLFGEPTSDPWTDSLKWAAPIWNRCNVTAHFPSSIDLVNVLDMVQECLPEFPFDQTYSNNVETVPDRDWVVHVQQSWSPIIIGKFLLRFPWHTEKEVSKAILEHNNKNEHEEKTISDEDYLHLKLQGGIAFGTGEHPTTQLCLEWIDKEITDFLSNKKESGNVNVMDYGAGSGVLGMAACAVDENVKSVGVDIDVDAIQIANANAQMNGLNMVNYLPPLMETADDESKSLLLKAHAHAEKQLQNQGTTNEQQKDSFILPKEFEDPIYDVCVANILAGPLVALAGTLSALVRPGGKLGMSGILPQQADMVIEAYSKASFQDLKVERELGGWILITGTKEG